MGEGILGEPRAAVEASGLRLTTMCFEEVGMEDISSSLIRRYLVTIFHLVPMEVLQYIVNTRSLADFYIKLYHEMDVHASIKDAESIVSRMPELSSLQRQRVHCQASSKK